MTARIEINPGGMVLVGLGVQGLQGPQGAAGAAGADGTNGTNGSDGADGAQGATGPQGDPGANGAAGPQGPAGADGAIDPTAPIILYNGPVDATNYERGFVRWGVSPFDLSEVFELGTEKGGAGTQFPLMIYLNGQSAAICGVVGQNLVRIRTGGAISLDVRSGEWSAGQWRSGAGTRIIGTDAGGGNPNRAADPLTIAAGLGTGSGAAGYVGTEAAPVGASGASLHTLEPICFDYVITAGEPMSALGGLTSAFPAAKRVGTSIQARLADDSGFATYHGRLRVHENAVTETIVCTHTILMEAGDGTQVQIPCKLV